MRWDTPTSKLHYNRLKKIVPPFKVCNSSNFYGNPALDPTKTTLCRKWEKLVCKFLEISIWVPWPCLEILAPKRLTPPGVGRGIGVFLFWSRFWSQPSWSVPWSVRSWNSKLSTAQVSDTVPLKAYKLYLELVHFPLYWIWCYREKCEDVHSNCILKRWLWRRRWIGCYFGLPFIYTAPVFPPRNTICAAVFYANYSSNTSKTWRTHE